MWEIPPGKPWEEIDREMLEQHRALKAREAAGEVVRTYPAARVHQMVLELIRRFEEAGHADPAIVQEVLAELHGEGNS